MDVGVCCLLLMSDQDHSTVTMPMANYILWEWLDGGPVVTLKRAVGALSVVTFF